MARAKVGLGRRAALIGLSALGVGAAGLFAARQSSIGKVRGHDPYFATLSAALKRAGLYKPTMVIDRAMLAHNIAAVKERLAGKPLGVRVVVKSLPAMDLIETVASGLSTNRFMVFNGAMLAEMNKHRPGADLLMGKPLPAAQTAQHLDAFGPSGAPQWLVDTPARLVAIADMAKARGQTARVNFEIDVGLHRGGFADAAALSEALQLAISRPELIVSGLMGYDPHVPKTPDPKATYQDVQKAYAAARDVLSASLGGDPQRFTLNTAGSPTYSLHTDDKLANEVSIGSAFVKPADFDLETLSAHRPAAFIATPVIKTSHTFRVPGVDALTPVVRAIDPAVAQAFFVYGGHWNARPVSPTGLKYNDLFGRSSNQELLTGDENVRLAVDDFVFLRPNQSEAVFLQFGDLAVYDRGEIVGLWPSFPVSA